MKIVIAAISLRTGIVVKFVLYVPHLLRLSFPEICYRLLRGGSRKPRVFKSIGHCHSFRRSLF